MGNTRPVIRRRRFLQTATGLSIGAGLAGCVGSLGGEGEFPDRDIEFLIPFSAGGGFDTYSRLIAKHAEKYLPDDVNTVPNNITPPISGTEQAFNAEASGYNLFTFSNFFQILFQIVQDTGYDLTQATQYPRYTSEYQTILVGSQTDLMSWDDTVSAIANEEVKIGTTSGLGVGVNITAIAALTDLFTIDNVVNNFVPYSEGTAEIVAGVRRGDVQVTTNSLSSARPHIESGTYRLVLYMNMDDSVPDWVMDNQDVEPDTLATASVQNGEQIADMTQFARFMGAPPDVPADRADYMRDVISQTLEDEEFLADAEEAGRPIVPADSETSKRIMENSHQNWLDNKDLLLRMQSGVGES